MVQRRGRRQRRVAAGDARPDGREPRCDLAVPAVEDDARAEDERREEGACGDALHRADPAPLRREHEEQRDPERRDRAAGDREPARAEEVEAGEQRAEVDAAGARAGAGTTVAGAGGGRTAGGGPTPR